MQIGMTRDTQYRAGEQRPVHAIAMMKFEPLASPALFTAIKGTPQRRLAHGGLKFPTTISMSHWRHA
jgi:hypothetical protein